MHIRWGLCVLFFFGGWWGWRCVCGICLCCFATLFPSKLSNELWWDQCAICIMSILLLLLHIHFRTDGSLFNFQRLYARTKTIEELITELLFADVCAILAHTEEALEHIINRFSDAAKNFGITISLKKVLYQPPTREAYSPHISIDGTNLNAVKQFTYLGSVISNNATVSKDLDNRLSKSSSSFGRLSKKVRQSYSLRLSTKIQV